MTTLTTFIQRHSLPIYFALVFAISWGGVLLVVGPGGLPIAAETFGAVPMLALLTYLAGPAGAGILLTALVYGRTGLRDLLSRLLKWRVGARWYAVALLAAPLVTTATLLVLSLFSREFLPIVFTPGEFAALLLNSIVSGLIVGLCEELGWTGFAIPRLRLREGILTTGLIVGLVWSVWHFPFSWRSDSFTGALPLAILLAGLFSWLPAYRILMVWVYDRTRSLLVAVLMHTSLVASQLILMEPLALTGRSLLTSILFGAAAWWLVVAAVMLANRRQPARPPLEMRPA